MQQILRTEPKTTIATIHTFKQSYARLAVNSHGTLLRYATKLHCDSRSVGLEFGSDVIFTVRAIVHVLEY